MSAVSVATFRVCPDYHQRLRSMSFRLVTCSGDTRPAQKNSSVHNGILQARRHVHTTWERTTVHCSADTQQEQHNNGKHRGGLHAGSHSHMRSRYRRDMRPNHGDDKQCKHTSSIASTALLYRSEPTHEGPIMWWLNTAVLCCANHDAGVGNASRCLMRFQWAYGRPGAE